MWLASVMRRRLRALRNMRLRFLRTTESDAPGMPFQAGQIITVPSLTRNAEQWIASGAVEVLRSEPHEQAVAPAREQAVIRHKGRANRARAAA